MKLDPIFLEILSFSISGIGIFNFLVRYDVPQLENTYYGKNLFKLKEKHINNVVNWFYAIPALMGLIIIPIKEIFLDKLPNRQESNLYYVVLLIGSILISCLLFKILSKLGIRLSRRKWEPIIIEEIIGPMRLIEDEKLIQTDKKRAEKIVAFIADILELNLEKDDLEDRYEYLKKYIESKREIDNIFPKVESNLIDFPNLKI